MMISVSAPGDLTEPEFALWQAFPRGEPVDLSAGDPAAGDPANGERWGPERTIRAEVIAALLLGAQPPEPGHVAAMRLTGARIAGSLRLAHAEASFPVRLTGCRLTCRADLYATRTRQLDFGDSWLPGMDLSLATIEGNLRLVGAHCEGRVRLTGAHIAGALLLQESRLVSPCQIALMANRLTVDGDVLCQGFSVEGEVRMAGATIGGMFGLSGARLDNPGGRALNAFNLTVGAHLWARDGFTAVGEVALGDATVRRDVDLSSATLRNPGGDALAADSLAVGTSLVLAGGLTAEGALRLAHAKIGGVLRVENARLTGGALVCRHAQGRELVLHPGRPIEETVDLSHARFEVIRDDPAAWPADLRLDGLGYDTLDPRLPAARRLAWLRRDAGGSTTRAYEQLAAMYRRIGDDGEARTVLLARQRQRWATLPWYARAWGRLQDVTVGYGYRPLRAAAWLVVLLLVGTVAFGAHHPPKAHDGDPPAFNPLIYSLDLMLPIIDFGLEHAYNPRGLQRWLAYALIVSGWVFATTIAAGVTRSLRRD